MGQTGKWTSRIVCILLVIGGRVVGVGQTLELEQTYPYTFFDTPAILAMDKVWVAEDGDLYQIPFLLEKNTSASLSYTFDLPCEIPDTVYLLLEGVGWETEAEFNGRYLGVMPQPLKPWVIPLDKQWLNPKENQLVLHLYRSSATNFYHLKPFWGIIGGGWLLEASQLAALQASPLESIPGTTDTVALVAPYYGAAQWIFSEEEAYRFLFPLVRERIKNIHFLFPPGRRLRALCAEMGLVEVDTLSLESSKALVNYYPYQPVDYPYSPWFWLEETGHRTAHFRHYFQASSSLMADRIEQGRLTLVLMIIFPLLALLIIKVLNKGLFEILISLLMQPVMYIDSLSTSGLSSQSLNLLLYLFRLIATAIGLAVGMYYVHRHGQWEWINVFRENSLLNRVFTPGIGLGGLLGRALLLGLIWTAVKFTILNFVGKIFRIKGLAAGVVDLEVVAAYPLALTLSIPWMLMLFVPHTSSPMIFYIAAFLLAIYFIRRLYVLFIGLDKMFSFSNGMKILYICAFNVAPYIIWF